MKGIRQVSKDLIKGNCLDNAVMENFIWLTQSELLRLQNLNPWGHFKLELTCLSDFLLNNHRIQGKAKGLAACNSQQQALSFVSNFCS